MFILRPSSFVLFVLAAFVLAVPAEAKERLKPRGHVVDEEPGEVFLQDTDLIDVPTAGVLDYGGASGRVRFFSGGGTLGWLGFGVFQRLNIGASLNVDRLIGSDRPIQLTRPELQVKYRFYDGAQVLPALALGFDGQGLFYDRSREKYRERQRGLYVAATKEVAASGFFLHAGGNVSDFDDNAVYGFLGADWNIEDKVSLIAEWDNVRNSEDSRFNAGLRVYASPYLQIDFAVREIGQGGRAGGFRREPERIVQMKYAGNF